MGGLGAILGQSTGERRCFCVFQINVQPAEEGRKFVCGRSHSSGFVFHIPHTEIQGDKAYNQKTRHAGISASPKSVVTLRMHCKPYATIEGWRRRTTVNRSKKEMQSAKYLQTEQTEKPRRCSDDRIAISPSIFLYFERWEEGRLQTLGER